MEKIACVAFHLEGTIISLPKPNRHGDVVKHMVFKLGYADTDDWDQGFLTSSSRYVDRTEGARIALESGQIEGLKWPPYLFSEDLW